MASQSITTILGKAYKQGEKNIPFHRIVYADGTVWLSDKYKKEGDTKFSMHVSREDLANIVGTATETVIRTLSDFKEDKLIEVAGGTITILNYDKLARMKN